MRRLTRGTIVTLILVAIALFVPVFFGNWFAGVGDAIVVAAVAYYVRWRHYTDSRRVSDTKEDSEDG